VAAIKDEDWVLSANTLEEWTRKIWDFDRPYRHPGKSLGTATQIGSRSAWRSRTAAPAPGRGPAARRRPDVRRRRAVGRGEAPHPVPCRHVQQPRLLQRLGAPDPHGEARGTPVERAYIGMDMDDPAPDFAALAKSMGWYAEGPIDRPGDVAPALKRAIAK
jgi:acetolactate synthase-1/2/3 large subunit